MKSTPLNETQLVRDLQAGHSAAFATLYDAYSPALFGALLRLVKDEQQAEDLLQDAFIKIWTNFHRYDAQQGRLFTWLLTVTRNVAMDWLRARKDQAPLQAYLADRMTASTSSPLEAMPNQSVFAILPAQYGQVLELTYQGYTKEEIATQFNLPLGTVKTRFRKALQKLNDIFHQDIYHYHAY
ncbi:RNA polymerase sigma factor [Spirosoma foliorum]|uniref:RNA polymerase sigma factor n=1 Tax=Spirosoma foliorum TaxID=2710596 RepID=A0A7G5GUE5_9BACT|nr:sigma-70 family RNA polymerase sigma factor [Spirosoma foliorum]QMW02487.1 sigma-70 family RNA polymerase sigma factor [Spirosoma foliorum]